MALSGGMIMLEGRVVTYTTVPVQGVWSWVEPLNVINYKYTAFELHRYCTMRYKYVGMSVDSAKSLAASIRSLLNREYYVPAFSNGEFGWKSGGHKIQGSVDVSKSVGHLYEVVVVINEHDVHLASEPPDDYDLEFIEENEREYVVS